MIKLKFLMFLKKIFYIKTIEEEDYKIYKNINFLGFSFCYRDIKKEQSYTNDQVHYLLTKVDELSKENHMLRIFFERAVDIKKIPPARGNHRKLQLIKTKLLELVSYVLKQNNITFWLDYGTLIGTIRHGGFIPWDDDIDVALLREDYIKLPKIFEQIEKADKNFKFTLTLHNHNIYRFFYKDFCVDFFPFEYVNKKYETPEEINQLVENWRKVNDLFMTRNTPVDYTKPDKVLNEINYAKQKFLGKDYQSNPESGQLMYSPDYSFTCKIRSIVNANNIFPLKEERFENLLLPVPNNPIEHLYEHHMYGRRGDIMNFPSIKDSGFSHLLTDYETLDFDYDNIYNELSKFTTDYLNETQNKILL